MAPEIRPAAATVVVRPAGQGKELLFVRRPESMRAFSGFHAFPGGVISEGDWSKEALALSVLSQGEAENAMAGDAGELPALGFYFCALRELFEEVGLLVATQNGRPADLDAGELAEMQDRLNSGSASFSELLRERDLMLGTDALHYHARWVAPEVLPVRFDLRVFVLERSGPLRASPNEVDALEWHSPQQILGLAEAGRVRLAPPTFATISSLAQPHSGSAVEILSTAVRRLVAPNESLMTGPGTNTYIVGLPPVVVIDPGSMQPEHLESIRREGPVGVIVVTHAHPDHLAGAFELHETTGAPIAASGKLWDKVGFPVPGRTLREGDRVDGGGISLTVLETPGHASDHICLFLEGESALFSGDLILGEGTAVISPPDGDLASYLASLNKVAALKPERLYPGHYPPRDDASSWIDWYISHRLERETQIMDCLVERPLSVPEIVERVYASYPKEIHPVAERSVLAHLFKLEKEKKVTEDGGIYRMVG